MITDHSVRQTFTDFELVCRVNNGDSTAFTLLLDRYMPILHKRAARYAGVMGVDVDDFVQEGMLALYRAVISYDATTTVQFSTYAGACIRNSMTDAIRAHVKALRKNSHISIDDLDETQILAQPQQRLIEDMLIEEENDFLRNQQIATLLSDFEQQVLKLYLSGYSYQHISGVLSAATKSVDNALQRVKRKLRQRA